MEPTAERLPRPPIEAQYAEHPSEMLLPSSALLPSGHSSVVIEHEGQRYVLRATRSGKLILTK